MGGGSWGWGTIPPLEDAIRGERERPHMDVCVPEKCSWLAGRLPQVSSEGVACGKWIRRGRDELVALRESRVRGLCCAAEDSGTDGT